jgi:hypothetical protein
LSSGLETDTASAQAIFQSCDGMEGLAAIESSAQPQRPRLGAFFHRIDPRLLVAGALASAATWLSQHYQSPVMLFALLFGMAFHFLYEEGRCVAGIEFSSKAAPRVGVALLGARINRLKLGTMGYRP